MSDPEFATYPRHAAAVRRDRRRSRLSSTVSNSDSESTTSSYSTTTQDSFLRGLFEESVVTSYFLAFLASLIVTIIALHFILKSGHPTVFPPDDPHVGWVANPDSRGTSNIIFTCLSTIYTCVYVSVHIDVPDPTEYNWLPGELSRRFPGSDGTLLAYTAKFLTKPALRKVYWVLFNIFAPEVMIYVAILEYCSASSGVAFMRSRGQDGWTMHHAFFADMGGFKLENGRVFRTGVEFYEWYDEERPRPKLDYAEIEEEIRDRSKANVVLKVYTCIQALWLLVEIVVRFARHQPVSELEVTTCTYILCTVTTYACWLRKPYGVDGRITLRSRLPGEGPESSQPAAVEWTRPSNNLQRFITAINDLLHRFASALRSAKLAVYTPVEDKEKRLPRIPVPEGGEGRITPSNRCISGMGTFVAAVATVFAGTTIGVIHAVPFWNADFAITEGRWIWRACCGIQAATPLAFEIVQIILGFITVFVDKRYKDRLLNTGSASVMFIYGISRCGLFALIFLSLKSQPVGVYHDVDWSWAAIPHWH